jgi:hypothetical protein
VEAQVVKGHQVAVPLADPVELQGRCLGHRQAT